MIAPALFCRTLCADSDADRVAAVTAELRQLAPERLPLHRATTQGGLVKPDSISISMLGAHCRGPSTVVRASVFFAEVIGGCNCHDDPLEANGYCVLEVTVDHRLGTVAIALMPD